MMILYREMIHSSVSGEMVCAHHDVSFTLTD